MDGVGVSFLFFFFSLSFSSFYSWLAAWLVYD